jgi:hypothetical protein
MEVYYRRREDPRNTVSRIPASAGTNGLNLNLETPRRIFDHKADRHRGLARG